LTELDQLITPTMLAMTSYPIGKETPTQSPNKKQQLEDHNQGKVQNLARSH